MGKPRNTRHTRKYPKYPEIPERKKDTRKYPIIFFDTPTRPEPDPLPGILSNTRPDIEKAYPLGTERQRGGKLFSCNHCNFKCALNVTLNKHCLIHTGEKSFGCEIRKSMRHIRTFTFNKRYYSSSQCENLRSDIAKKHVTV